MGKWRQELEDKVTVTCQRCKKEWLYYEKYPSQKYGLCELASVSTPKCTEFKLHCKTCSQEFTITLRKGTSKTSQEQQLKLARGQLNRTCGPCQKIRNMGVTYIGD